MVHVLARGEGEASKPKQDELAKPGPKPQRNQTRLPVPPWSELFGVAVALRRVAWRHSVTACLD